MASFRDGLAKLAWVEGRNLRIDYRWGDDAGKLSAYAAELVALMPDAIFAMHTPSAAVLHRTTATVPIVFANVGDPIAIGVVSNTARPAVGR